MSDSDFSEAWSREHGNDQARHVFGEVFGQRADVVVGSAPGRVNLIGEHTDYNGGPSLPIALAHRTYVAAAARSDSRVELVSEREGQRWSADLNELTPGSESGWGTYVAGVAWALRQEGIEVPGFDLAVASCVPYGAGLSSSAALECATLMAIRALMGDAWNGPDLGTDDGRRWAARICVRAENEIAGAPTGGMDQAASMQCTPGHALLVNVEAGIADQVPFDPAAGGLELLVIDTRAQHSLVDGQYGQRRDTTAAAAQALGVATLGEVSDLPAALERIADAVARQRVAHVVSEIGRVADFVSAMQRDDWASAGELMFASHESLARDYEVSCAELDTAVRAARDAGAIGARMTGGGFGGSAIALIPAGTAGAVAAQVRAAFADAGHEAPAFLVAQPSGPAA